MGQGKNLEELASVSKTDGMNVAEKLNVAGLSVQIHQGEGPFILLVHGMLASRSQFLLNLPSVAKCCTPVTVELLGHHDSESPENAAAYSPSQYVDSFEAIRRHLAVPKWLVAGCSLGAALTMNYVLAHPEHVSGHVFTNSSSAFAERATLRTWQQNSEQGYRRLLTQGTAGLERIAVHPRFAKRLPAEVKAALLRDSSQHNVEGIAATMRWTSPFSSVRERVHEITVPSLLLCGKFEKRFQPHRRFAAECMTNLEICDLDAGHGVNMEAAPAFNEQLTNFVMRL